MGLKIQIIAFIIGVLYFIITLRQIKKNHLRPSYSILWLSVSAFLISITVLEPVYQWISYRLMGIVDARHIIYISLIGFLLVYAFYLTIKVNRLSDQVQELISHNAIMRTKIESMEITDEDN